MSSSSEEDIMARWQSDSWQSDSWRVKVDDDISGLSKKMAGFESVLSNVAHGMDALSNKFDKIQSDQANNSKTQWPIIFGALTLALFMVGAFAGGYVRELEKTEEHTTNNTDKIFSHLTSNDPHRIGTVFDAKLVDFRQGLRRELNVATDNQFILHSQLDRRLSLIESRQYESRKGLD